MQDVWDGEWLLMDHDPVTGRSTWATHQDGNLVVRVDQPLAQIFDANADAEKETQGRRFGDWVRIASVPHHLTFHNGLDQAMAQHDDKFIAKVLNDPDNAKFRTSRGRV